MRHSQRKNKTDVRKKLSVVVPCYNEAENIPVLFDEITRASSDWTEPWECIIVDDSSTDNTYEIACHLAKQKSSWKVLTLPVHQGQSAAFWRGFREARGEIIATLDADLQCAPGELKLLINELPAYDAVFGLRRKRRDSAVKRLSSNIANAVRQYILHDNCPDTGCPLKLMRRECLSALLPFNGMHRFMPALLGLENFKIRYILVSHFPRRHGNSKYNIGNRLFKGLIDLLFVRWLQKNKIHSFEKAGSL